MTINGSSSSQDIPIDPPKVYKFGRFQLDTGQRLLTHSGSPVKLKLKSFEVLECLVQRSNQVIEKGQLMQEVWPDSFVEDANLTVHVSALRKIFADAGDDTISIETFPKVGYRLTANVTNGASSANKSVGDAKEQPDVSGRATAAEFDERPDLGLPTKTPSSLPIKPYVLAGLLAVLIAVAAGLAFFSKTVPPINKTTSIAVLPFENETGSTEDDYLSDGLTEMLIRKLSETSGLSVKARGSVFRYKGTETESRKAGLELSAQTVVVGRIASDGPDYVVGLEMIDVGSGDVLWAETYRRRPDEIPLLAGDISQSVLGKLEVGVDAARRPGPAQPQVLNGDAYRLYLRGRHHWYRRTNEDFKVAIGYFQRAIEAEPDFALAYSGLSDSYTLLIAFGGAPPENVLPQARSTAQRSVELDPDSAETHASLGNVAWSENDTITAEREFRRAIQLNPNYSTAIQWLSEILSNDGKYDEADVLIRRALDLDPLSRMIKGVEARNHFWAGRPDQAIAVLKRNIDLDPTWGGDHDLLFHIYESKEMYPEAVDAYLTSQSLLKATPENELQRLRESFEKGGWTGFVQRRVQFLEQRSKEGYVKAVVLAEWYARAGDNDRAFDLLYEARANNTLLLGWFERLAAFKGLRADPRYSDLISK